MYCLQKKLSIHENNCFLQNFVVGLKLTSLSYTVWLLTLGFPHIANGHTLTLGGVVIVVLLFS